MGDGADADGGVQSFSEFSLSDLKSTTNNFKSEFIVSNFGNVGSRRDDQNWCCFAAKEIVGDDRRKLRRRIAFRFSGAVSRRKRSSEMIGESFDDDDVSPFNSHEVHVFAVDDSLVD
ncbi:hypothetical protein LOK49_LG01G01129 [Camellia lanceoleosa]|uniref:Uncharacterized protein n=1 Tax=Camellia lanceoleosa TaxID=1840588 RepID=A0ACC0J3E3_9ERIC|nr:hypothetical protein LOK49_LG01G01129 [Camellia lanceoleosa]